jgi:hypothetical protein
MLFAMPDICLLAKILTQEEFSSARRIPLDRKIDFEFFRYEVSEIAFLGIAPLAADDARLLPANTRLAAAASGLYKFLTHAKEEPAAPDDLAEFLRYHELSARRRVDFQKYAYINHLSVRLAELGEGELADLFPALESEIECQRENVDTNYRLLTAIARVTVQLDAEVEAYERKADQSFAILYGCLLMGFLESDPSIGQTFSQHRETFLTDKRAFMDFLISALTRLKTFLQPIADYSFPRVSAHFHTWMMQRLPLREFISGHPGYTLRDDALSTVSKDVIAKVCVVPAPPKLKMIFANPPLFQFCEIELLNAEFLELPLEAIERITAARSLLEKVFELAFGEGPQADEMTPLFNYALLASGISKMFSLHKYLEHFLALPPGDVQFLDNARSVALTHFIGHVAALEQALPAQ